MDNQEIARALDELLDEIAKDTEERHDEEIRRWLTARTDGEHGASVFHLSDRGGVRTESGCRPPVRYTQKPHGKPVCFASIHGVFED